MILRAITTAAVISNTNTATPVIPQFQIDATAATVGRSIRMVMAGYYSTGLSLLPTLTMDLMGGPAGTTLLGQCTSQALIASANNEGFWATLLATIVATGANGQVRVAGKLDYSTGLGGSARAHLVTTAPVTVDLSANNLWMPRLKISTASASNVVTVTNAEAWID